jgi:glutamate--cysteine ligase
VPTPTRQLQVGEAEELIRRRSFCPEARRRVGVELEWLTVRQDDPFARVDPGLLAPALAAAGELPGGGRVTYEPGGQLELSSRPRTRIADTCADAASDLAVVAEAAAGRGVLLVGSGADPLRPPARVVRTPRYDAMEAYFDADGPAGRRMMCNTAAVQVNVGIGPGPDEAARQWRLAQDLGPTLVAAFANSPLVEGEPSGFRSARMATWWALDRSRTAPVPMAGDRPGPDSWVAYVLDARVMLVRAHDDRYMPVRSPMSFRQWMVEDHELGWPSPDDLEYHLGTLFPPVRPRGWLELRMVDALPDPWWRVPLAVAAALLADPQAGETVQRALGQTGAAAPGRWVDAARTALAHPALAAAAVACFDAALDALARLDAHAALVDTAADAALVDTAADAALVDTAADAALVDTAADAALVDLVAAYADRWTRRGRCPADDRLDEWADDDRVLADRTAEELPSWT